MIQLIFHLLGDYVLQSHWMAQNKTKCAKAAAMHAMCYSTPFIVLDPSLPAFLVILLSHFVIDRYSLARVVVWLKNVTLNPRLWVAWWRAPFPEYAILLEHEDHEETARWKWANCSVTGYPSDTPPWLAVWLLIAADNTLHLVINYAALRWL